MSFFWTNLVEQFASLPYPAEDCSGRVFVVTGSSGGLGLEVVRHYVRLNAARVIMACRDVDKGEAARRDVEATTQRTGVAEVWQLDLESFDSVKDFATRVHALERLDVLINNAGMLSIAWEMAEVHEKQTTVNVISTLLLSVLALPALRRTGVRFNVTPHITIVSSAAADLPAFAERKTETIMYTLATNKAMLERYNTTKLLQVMMTAKLAEAAEESGKGHVIVNVLNPGFCQTSLFRRWPFPLSTIIRGLLAVGARSAEAGSRTIVSAACAGDETNGKFLSSCRVREMPPLMRGDEGEKLTDKIWAELGEILDANQPGVMNLI